MKISDFRHQMEKNPSLRATAHIDTQSRLRTKINPFVYRGFRAS